ncbi:hypothetical protein HAX54_006074 [Datura stramonium]|uniref:Uncharacterized protein n=1 Tax=Datura stramonium TaxID=4076 RepID=A0ABS8WYN5_DATST|nr:hypothetical protein [Datura stramonium]
MLDHITTATSRFYKGKGKEKKPTEAKAESESDPELEEALRKAKEDEERRPQLRYKRGKDALRFNIVHGMKERFFDGTHNRNFNEERKFILNRIEEDFPNILRQIKERYWEIFTIPPGRYCLTLVHEFYASYRTAQKHQKDIDPLRLRPCLQKVKVKGVEVD